MSQVIHTGLWIDWTHGRVAGATITLSARDGAFLLAFVATFVTMVAARTWRMVSFMCHKALASGGKHDGLYYQRQLILRNTPTPVSAAWLFLQQAWHWRRVADRSLRRTLPWTVGGLLYVGLFPLAAIFSFKISDAATEFRLLKPTGCGWYLPSDDNAPQEKATSDNLIASAYSRQCYWNEPGLACDILPVKSIGYTNYSVDCPFRSDVCKGAKSIRMENDRINSHVHLGINAPKHDRIDYQRQTTCSPLVTQPGFADPVNGAEARDLGWDDGILIKYLYGPVGNNTYTFMFNTYATEMQTGYFAWSYVNMALIENHVSEWRPSEALSLEGRDVTLLLIAPNSVFHLKPNDDPVFGTRAPNGNGSAPNVYLPDRPVSPIACADGHRMCNPNNGRCTPFRGAVEIFQKAWYSPLDLSPAQKAVGERLEFASTGTTFYDLVWTRAQSFLNAQELVSGMKQLPLPSDQWELEMKLLFSVAMAKLQHRINEYVTGPPVPVRRGLFVDRPWEVVHDAAKGRDYGLLCRSHRSRQSQGTINFSVLGLSVLLGLGALVIALSFLLEPLIGWLQRRTGYGAAKAKRWERDENLQVMRMLLELKEAGEWKGTTESFPVAESHETFE